MPAPWAGAPGKYVSPCFKSGATDVDPAVELSLATVCTLVQLHERHERQGFTGVFPVPCTLK